MANTSALDVLENLNIIGELCTPETGEESIDLSSAIESMMKLACVVSGKYLYAYQQEFIRRVFEAILLHKGDMLTGLWARQSGKTEAIAAIALVAMIMFPELAKQFSKDWRFNITDEQGRYRGFKKGINFGIYAPILEQSEIMLDRIRTNLDNDETKEVLAELGISVTHNRGSYVKLSNGSTVLAMSASINSKIEGHTHHVVIAEEAQDIDAQKIRKSIHPMIASTKGMIIKIGTATIIKGDFYEAIRFNVRLEVTKGVKNHYFYPYTVCVKYNSLYRDYIEQEKLRIGVNSDEFRMSYGCEWLLERGMFVIDQVLMARNVAVTYGKFSRAYAEGFAGQNLVVGIDLGKETDSTVVTVMDVNWSEPVVQQFIMRDMRETEFVAYQKHLIAWMEFKGDDYEYQYHELCEWLSSFRPIRKIVLDATRESSFADRISHTAQFKDAEVEDFVFGTQTKAAGYRLLHGDLLAKRVTFPAGDEARATDEYRKFVVQMLDLVKTYVGDYLCVGHPEEPGAHDDYPDSFMLANWGANEPTADMGVEQFTGNAFM